MRAFVYDVVLYALASQFIIFCQLSINLTSATTNRSCIIEVNNITIDDCDLLNFLCGENAVFVNGECACKTDYVIETLSPFLCISVNETRVPTVSPSASPTGTPTVNPTSAPVRETLLPTTSPTASPTVRQYEFQTGTWSSCLVVGENDGSCTVTLGERVREVECIDRLRDKPILFDLPCLFVSGVHSAPQRRLPCLVNSCSNQEPVESAGQWQFESSEGLVEEGAYGECTAVCGGGEQFRSEPVCVIDGEIVDDNNCNNLLKPEARRGCNQLPCPNHAVLENSQMSSCSGTCTAYGATRVRTNICFDSTSGIPTSSVNCEVSNIEALTIEGCMPAGCATTVLSGPTWNVGAWFTCSTTCGSGTQSRVVKCVDSVSGAELSTSFCLAIESKPATIQNCISNASCPKYIWLYSVKESCKVACAAVGKALPSGEGLELSCVSSSGGSVVDNNFCRSDIVFSDLETQHTCECNRRLTSMSSDISAIPWDQHVGSVYHRGEAVMELVRTHPTAEPGPSSRESRHLTETEECSSGIRDVQGNCCQERQSLDRTGSCCDASKVDACGRCAELPQAPVHVDISGQCCDGLLDASGGCCESGIVDRCGVCEGDGLSCGMKLAFSLAQVNNSQLVSGLDAQRDKSEAQQLAELKLVTAETLALEASHVHQLSYEMNTEFSAVVSSEVLARPVMGSVTESLLLKLAQLQGARFSFPDNWSSWVYEVAGWESEGICGNNICEINEICTDNTATCCFADCAVEYRACPSDSNGSVCSGLGTCNHASGNCICFPGTGRTGTACQQCRAGFSTLADGSCVAPLQRPPSGSDSCSNGVLDGNESAVDCGGPVCGACGQEVWVWVSVGVLSPVVFGIFVWFLWRSWRVRHNRAGRHRYRRKGHKGVAKRVKAPTASPKSRILANPKTSPVVVSVTNPDEVSVEIQDITPAQGRDDGGPKESKLRRLFHSKRSMHRKKPLSQTEYAISTYIPQSNVQSLAWASQDDDSVNSSHSEDGENAFLTRALEQATPLESWVKIRCAMGANSSLGKSLGITGLSKRYQELYCVVNNQEMELQYYNNMVPSKYGHVYVGLKGAIPVNKIQAVEQSDIATAKSAGMKVTLWLACANNKPGEHYSHEIRLVFGSLKDAQECKTLLSHYSRRNAIEYLKIGGPGVSTTKVGELRRFSSATGHPRRVSRRIQPPEDAVGKDGPLSAPHRSIRESGKSFFPGLKQPENGDGNKTKRPNLPLHSRTKGNGDMSHSPPQTRGVEDIEVFLADDQVPGTVHTREEATKGRPPPLPPLDVAVAKNIINSSDLMFEGGRFGRSSYSDDESLSSEPYQAPLPPLPDQELVDQEDTEPFDFETQFSMENFEGDGMLPPSAMDQLNKIELNRRGDAKKSRYRAVVQSKVQGSQHRREPNKNMTMAARVAMMSVRQHRLAQRTSSMRLQALNQRASETSKTSFGKSRKSDEAMVPVAFGDKAKDIWDNYQFGLKK